MPDVTACRSQISCLLQPSLMARVTHSCVAGALHLLTAALGTSRDAAREAATVIEMLLARNMPSDTKATLCQQLHQMQAVHRLSHLLCPPFVTAGTVPTKSHGKGFQMLPTLLQ